MCKYNKELLPNTLVCVLFLYLQKKVVKKSDAIPSEQKELLVKIGKKLQKLRAERGNTYVKTAKEMGVPRNTLNRMELGRINFQLLTLVRVLNYYHLSISQFFDELD